MNLDILLVLLIPVIAYGVFLFEKEVDDFLRLEENVRRAKDKLRKIVGNKDDLHF